MDFKEYSLTNRSRNTIDLVFSIIATMFGASAIFGTITYIFNEGQAYIWFLWISSIALLIKGFLFSTTMYHTNATTLPEAFGIVIHPYLRTISAGLITTSWIGIIAAQLVAAGSVIKSFFPFLPYEISLIIFTVIIIIYTAQGGQKAVFVTDKIQLIIMIISFTTLIMILTKNHTISTDIFNTNALFGSTTLMISWFISKGLSVLVGPDMYTRISSAKNASTAKRALIISGGIHFIISILILTLGIILKQLATPNETMFEVINHNLSYPIVITASIGFICAIASSCDTTLINTALIIENDLFRSQNTKRTVLFVYIIGIISLIIALTSSDVLKLIISAYSLYAPVSVPLFIVGILFYHQRYLNTSLVFGYVGIGIIVAIYGIIKNIPLMSIYITIFGFFIGVLAVIFGRNRSLNNCTNVQP